VSRFLLSVFSVHSLLSGSDLISPIERYPYVEASAQPGAAPEQAAATQTTTPTSPSTTTTPKREPTPFWLYILGGFSLLLGIVTAIPQFYYVLFAINPHVFPIGPNTNPLGDVWYSYILVGDNSYQKVDPGILAGAVEDAFLLGPLYFTTGIGLLRRSSWVFVVGLTSSRA
jgi:hypothetical protein